MATATAQRPSIFGRTDRAAADKDMEKSSFWKVKEGDSKIRILPPLADESLSYYVCFKHYGIGANNMPFYCPLKSERRKSCYLCRQANKLAEDERKAMTAGKKWTFRIWDYEAPDRGVQLWEVGYQIKNQLDKMRVPDEPSWDDPDDGYDIIVSRVGNTKNTTRYTCTADRKNSALKPVILAWCENNEIPSNALKDEDFKTDAEMKAAYEGGFEDDEDDEVEAEVMQRTREAPRSAPRSTPRVTTEVDTSSAEDDYEEDQEEEEEEVPATRTRGGRTAPVATRTPVSTFANARRSAA